MTHKPFDTITMIIFCYFANSTTSGFKQLNPKCLPPVNAQTLHRFMIFITIFIIVTYVLNNLSCLHPNLCQSISEGNYKTSKLSGLYFLNLFPVVIIKGPAKKVTMTPSKVLRDSNQTITHHTIIAIISSDGVQQALRRYY